MAKHLRLAFLKLLDTTILSQKKACTINRIYPIRYIHNAALIAKVESQTHSNLEIIENEEVPESILPTYNLSACVKESANLQQLVKLGVDLHKVEKRKGLAQFLLQQEFNENIAGTILFLQDQGVPIESMGQWLTKNPLIFKENLQTLQERVNYLAELKLSQEERARIICLNPFWMMFSIDRIERRLGFFQRNFSLKSQQVLNIAVKQPRLITYNLEHIREVTFCLREEMGFVTSEIRELLLKKPRLCMMRSSDLIERFAYAHKEMKLSNTTLLEFPELLCSRINRLRDRHEFVKLLGRAQYDPKHDLYISPDEVVKGDNAAFCRHVAKCELEVFEAFLRTR